MSKLSTRSLAHRWLTSFVDWIKPEDDTEDDIREHADLVRARIKAKARADGLIVRSTPWSGSFVKKTGLRRHMRGDHEVVGQDVDMPFVVSPQTKDGEDIESLLDRFERYASESYPDTARNPTKSSIRLEFKKKRLSYDLVPMLAVPEDDEAQILLRSDGERRQTSVQKHTRFIQTRNAKSNALKGRVKFHEGVRLVKWWREMRQSQSQVVDYVPSIVIDLLCGKAFDEDGVDETYTETLSRWFSRMAHIVRRRLRVDFTDFVSPVGYPSTALWTVLDPVSPENNVVPTAWKSLHLSELAEWLEAARDGMARAIVADISGDKADLRRELVTLFGNAIADHGEDA